MDEKQKKNEKLKKMLNKSIANIGIQLPQKN